MSGPRQSATARSTRGLRFSRRQERGSFMKADDIFVLVLTVAFIGTIIWASRKSAGSNTDAPPPPRDDDRRE